MWKKSCHHVVTSIAINEAPVPISVESSLPVMGTRNRIRDLLQQHLYEKQSIISQLSHLHGIHTHLGT
jgi:hypothetical protein